MSPGLPRSSLGEGRINRMRYLPSVGGSLGHPIQSKKASGSQGMLVKKPGRRHRGRIRRTSRNSSLPGVRIVLSLLVRRRVRSLVSLFVYTSIISSACGQQHYVSMIRYFCAISELPPSPATPSLRNDPVPVHSVVESYAPSPAAIALSHLFLPHGQRHEQANRRPPSPWLQTSGPPAPRKVPSLWS